MPTPFAVNVQTDSYCGIARPITWDVKDTRPTIDQVRRENAKHTRVCRKRAK
jgi:hypothetical protein